MIYGYKCNKCGEEFELHRAMDERNDPAECPKCKSNDSTRVMGTPFFVTAGGGHKNKIR